jgi:hypothetical protein
MSLLKLVTDKMWEKYSQVRFDSVGEKMMGAFLPINAQPQPTQQLTGSSDRKSTRSSQSRADAAPLVPAEKPQQPASPQSFTFAGGFHGYTW